MNLGGLQAVKSMSVPSSSLSRKSGDGVSDQFPAGLRVLVVDDDPICLLILEKMLKKCLYEGTLEHTNILVNFSSQNCSFLDFFIFFILQLLWFFGGSNLYFNFSGFCMIVHMSDLGLNIQGFFFIFLFFIIIFEIFLFEFIIYC